MPFQIASIKKSLELLHDLSTPTQGLPGTSQATAEGPDTLLEGMHQLLSMAQQIDDGKTDKPFSAADVTQLGEYGLQLLADLYLQASNHTNESYPAIIQQIAIALSNWIMRHGGTLQTLEPVVDGLIFPLN